MMFLNHARKRLTSACQIFRFGTSKNESLFLQRKNPRKIAWTQVFRRMRKKGVTEEAAKKRSRKTVKHQRGIVGADLKLILEKRNQTQAMRTLARQQAIAKAKESKKRKEETKVKVKASRTSPPPLPPSLSFLCRSCSVWVVLTDILWSYRQLLDRLVLLHPRSRNNKPPVLEEVERRVVSGVLAAQIAHFCSVSLHGLRLWFLTLAPAHVILSAFACHRNALRSARVIVLFSMFFPVQL